MPHLHLFLHGQCLYHPLHRSPHPIVLMGLACPIATILIHPISSPLKSMLIQEKIVSKFKIFTTDPICFHPLIPAPPLLHSMPILSHCEWYRITVQAPSLTYDYSPSSPTYPGDLGEKNSFNFGGHPVGAHCVFKIEFPPLVYPCTPKTTLVWIETFDKFPLIGSNR